MKNPIKLVFALAILFLANNLFAQEDIKPQEFLIGTFKYCNETAATIVMTKNKAVETIIDARGEKIVVTSKIKWISENQYEVTFKKVKGPTDLEKGITVLVYVKKIEGDEAQVAFTFSTGLKNGNCFKKIN